MKLLASVNDAALVMTRLAPSAAAAKSGEPFTAAASAAARSARLCPAVTVTEYGVPFSVTRHRSPATGVPASVTSEALAEAPVEMLPAGAMARLGENSPALSLAMTMLLPLAAAA